MNPKFITIIAAVVSSASLAAVVEKTGMSNAALIGCVSAMKKAGLVEYADKTITLTEEGKKHLPVAEVVEVVSTEKKITKADVARKILARPEVASLLAQKKRAEVKEILMKEAGLTKDGAHTYIYTYESKMKEVNKPFMEILFSMFAVAGPEMVPATA